MRDWREWAWEVGGRQTNRQTDREGRKGRRWGGDNEEKRERGREREIRDEGRKAEMERKRRRG